MENERIFIFDGKILLLDKVLVEFNGTPIFFVCKSGEEYYIALYVGSAGDRYFVTQITLTQLSKMLYGKITMRDLMLQNKIYWDVFAGETIEEDVVTLKGIEDIPLDELPYEDAYLEIVTKDLKQYAKKIDEMLYVGAFWDFICEQYLEKQGYFVESELKETLETVAEGLVASKIQMVECKEVFEASTFTLEEKQKEKIPVEINIDSKMAFAA